MASAPRPRIGAVDVPPCRREGRGSDLALRILRVAPATQEDERQVVAVIGEAFVHDPTWSWAFPDPGARQRWWQVCTQEALRYPWVLRTEGFEAVSVWIPPGGTEFSAETEARLPDLLTELVGTRSSDVAELLRRFGEAHPRHTAHYYLSLLATADEHRGRGLGIALLRENLARIDLDGHPAYLESSNPQNNPRYEALGFVPITSFEAPGRGPTVTGMWRERQTPYGLGAG